MCKTKKKLSGAKSVIMLQGCHHSSTLTKFQLTSDPTPVTAVRLLCSTPS